MAKKYLRSLPLSLACKYLPEIVAIPGVGSSGAPSAEADMVLELVLVISISPGDRSSC